MRLFMLVVVLYLVVKLLRRRTHDSRIVTKAWWEVFVCFSVFLCF